MAHLSGHYWSAAQLHYWSYEYALLFSFFRPEQDQLPTQAQVDTFKAEFDLLSEADVKELVAYLAL